MKTFFELREKTLTKAELKKREEVAKAIERENPNMPMAKKMAIATATAKKVAEEAEQIDEISRDLARRYIRKVADKTNTGELSTKQVMKRRPGVTLAGKKAYPGVAGEPRVRATESVELDELSKKTLGTYVKKATGSAVGLGAITTAQAMSSKGKADPDDKRQLRNRMTGVSRATDRLTKEEAENLDEISRDLARSYIRKATADNKERRSEVMKPFNIKDMDKNISQFKKMKSREKGIETAGKKAYDIGGKAKVPARESVELDEISRDLATRAAQGFANKADAAHNKKDYAGFKKGEAARKMAIAKVQGRAKVSAVARRVEETERE